MRVLLDNATITASFRAAGLIEVKNKELFNLDVVALRTLIDNILLADEIIIPDNYKNEFRGERKDWLGHACFTHLEPDERIEKLASRNAVAQVHNWKLHKHLSTDFVKIFDDISILFRHAWRGSQSFLVLKAMGIEDKYNSSITESLMQYLTTDEKQKALLKKFHPKAYNQETIKLAQSISWSAIRTVYHRQLAKFYGAEYISHPLRNLYNAKCILFDNHPFARTEKLHSASLNGKNRYELEKLEQTYLADVNNFFSNFWETCNQKDSNVFGVETFDIDMPPFLSYTLQCLTDNPFHSKVNVIEHALKLRDRKEFTSLRSKLKETYADNDAGSKRMAIREFGTELRDLKHEMQIYLGYDREKVGISVKMLSYDFTVPRFFTKPLYPHKPHLACIRDVILELANVSAMGRQLDLLWRNRKE